jgi:hypothetical protein
LENGSESVGILQSVHAAYPQKVAGYAHVFQKGMLYNQISRKCSYHLVEERKNDELENGSPSTGTFSATLFVGSDAQPREKKGVTAG